MAPKNKNAASPVSAWKKAPTPVELPSGNYMIVKRVGLKAFLVRGIIPNSLMAAVQSSLESGISQVDEKKMMQDIFTDPEKLTEFMGMMDDVVLFCAVEPKIHPIPKNDQGEDDDALKDPNILYIDELDENDKMAIFQYACGEAVELESFRS